jgi:hypothetical protein
VDVEKVGARADSIGWCGNAAMLGMFGSSA